MDDRRGDGGYIPNTVTLGGKRGGYEDDSQISNNKMMFTEGEFNPKLLLLTGPNMGGESSDAMLCYAI